MVRKEHLYGVAPCLAALSATKRKLYKVYLNEKYQSSTPRRL